MTLMQDRPERQLVHEEPVLMEIVPGPRPSGLVKYITSTDHKQIGLNYLVTSFIGFLFAGLLAVGIRTQLIVPNNNFDINVTTPGIYPGQCNNICGTYHAYMRFLVDVMPASAYNTWYSAQGSCTVTTAGGPVDAPGDCNITVPQS